MLAMFYSFKARNVNVEIIRVRMKERGRLCSHAFLIAKLPYFTQTAGKKNI